MTRTLTTAAKNALDDATVRPFYLLYSEFDGTTLRLFSGSRDLSYGGNTWLGNGWFRGMSSIRETGAIEASGIEVVLSGVPQTLLSLVLSYARQNLPGIVYLGLFDSSYAIIADPIVLFEGGFDVAKINRSPSDNVISLSYESNLASLRRRKEVRFTDQQQRLWYPSDRGFEFVAALAEWNGFWGNKEADLGG